MRLPAGSVFTTPNTNKRHERKEFPMMYKLVAAVSLVSVLLMTSVGCGSTQTRDEAQASSVSEDVVYAKIATLRVDGLGCPMCAESISILMGNIDAVNESRVDLSTGTVHVDLNPEVGVSAAQLRGAIIDGGFTFRSIAFEK